MLLLVTAVLTARGTTVLTARGTASWELGYGGWDVGLTVEGLLSSLCLDETRWHRFAELHRDLGLKMVGALDLFTRGHAV